MIIELFMGDFYPSLHSDQRLQFKHFYSMKMDDDQKRVGKTRQFEKMVLVEKIIKKYKRWEEAQKLRVDQLAQGEVVLEPELTERDRVITEAEQKKMN